MPLLNAFSHGLSLKWTLALIIQNSASGRKKLIIFLQLLAVVIARISDGFPRKTRDGLHANIHRPLTTSLRYVRSTCGVLLLVR